MEQSLPQLTMDHDKVETKLKARIDKGIKIKECQIQNENQLSKADSEYGKWHKYNVGLLKLIFTDKTLSEEYEQHYSPAPHTIEYDPMAKGLTHNKKVYNFRAKIDAKIKCLESIIERLNLYEVTPAKNFTTPSHEIDKSKIFIVHGLDNEAKLEVAKFIKQIDLEPIILHEQVNRGQTIIEKIEEHSDVGFGVVIYTPCDVGSENTTSHNLEGRARQNVVFEAGFLTGKLGRTKVCYLVKGKVELPNDISGMVYIKMADNWEMNLAKELKDAGYQVDMNKAI